MQEELWADDVVPNYAISSYGRVINLTTGHEKVPRPDKNGYLKLDLYYKGVRHSVYLHRLVAKAFFLNYEDGVQVLHRDENKNDCSVLNLTLGRGCRGTD